MAGSDNDKLVTTMTTGKSKQKMCTFTSSCSRQRRREKTVCKVKQRDKKNITPPSGRVLYCTHNSF